MSQTRYLKQAPAPLIPTASSFGPVVLEVSYVPPSFSLTLGLPCPSLPRSPRVSWSPLEGSQNLFPGLPPLPSKGPEIVTAQSHRPSCKMGKTVLPQDHE